MAKRQQKSSWKVTRRGTITIGAIAAAIALVSYFGLNAAIPANGTSPVFGFANNHYIKATHSSGAGYVYISQSSGSVKGLKNSGGGGGTVNPTYMFRRGELESIHVINEGDNTHSNHNFNIDEFNVHTKDLGNFQAQTVTFVADKAGTFNYYCTVHPEMNGKIVIE